MPYAWAGFLIMLIQSGTTTSANLLPELDWGRNCELFDKTELGHIRHGAMVSQQDFKQWGRGGG